MHPFSFFWHDYETFGGDARRDRPSQFAGVRTDAELNEIDAPVMHYCQPAPDYLPEPEACLLTGILPQAALARGLPEHAFAGAVLRELGRPGTVGTGYNSIRFDDEFTRFLLWRSLLDPFAREWQDDCGRWDLLDTLRCAWALRPEGIAWPTHEDGRPSFRLEHLSAANGLAHEAAHDALSDVRATLGLARLLKARQPRLWAFCLRLREKAEVLREIGSGKPFLHVSGMYGVERGGLALVWPIGPHPTHKNELIVWDLAHDPAQLLDLDVETIRLRLFTKAAELPPELQRLPVKTVHVNKSPVVISNLAALRPETAERWSIDVALGLRHAETAARHAERLLAPWPAVYARPPRTEPVDVDADLYGGFLGDEDRRRLQRLRALAPEQLGAARPAFEDGRLDELLFRYRARNFPQTLTGAEQQRWEAHRARRLHEASGDALTLDAFFERIDALEPDADERGQELLGALVDYATGIAPDRA